MITDAQLAEGLARDVASGLESVYNAYAAKLYTYALTMLRDPASAQDVVHDALLVAAGSIGQLRDPMKLRPWLYAITRNECLRTLRGRTRFSDSDEVVEMADTVDFEAGLRRDEAARLISQAMAAMSPADRDIVTLALQHDLDVERISEVTGATPNTVHARLSRARAGLSDAVSALALYRSRSRCEELQAIISPPDQPLTPLLRKRIGRHIKSCDDCEQRRRAALAAMGPAMAAPLYVTPPDTLPARIVASLQAGDAERLVRRAAPFNDDGFPVPLDGSSRSKWLLPAAFAGVGLIVLGLVGILLMDSSPSEQSTIAGSVTQATSPSPSSTPTVAEPTETTATEPVVVEEGPAFVAPTVAPQAPVVATPTALAPQPTRTTSQPKASAKPSVSAKPSASAKPTTSKAPVPQESSAAPAPPPARPPTITAASMKDEDQAADGSFTRCDAFTLRITAAVTGADATEALISPSGAATLLTGDPLSGAITLPPGEYSVAVRASGPGGTATRDLGTVLHICPG
ncbi:MAG: sigma-70 family RNA polymerase sigma factor [Candidatus Nanopelagicales bacterium]